MSNESLESKPTRVEELQEGDIVQEEQPEVVELTQNDHINKAMLQMFKNRIDQGGFNFKNQNDDDQSAMDDEFIDSDEEDQKIVEPVSN